MTTPAGGGGGGESSTAKVWGIGLFVILLFILGLPEQFNNFIAKLFSTVDLYKAIVIVIAILILWRGRKKPGGGGDGHH